jgi:hypothetical protein
MWTKQTGYAELFLLHSIESKMPMASPAGRIEAGPSFIVYFGQ